LNIFSQLHGKTIKHFLEQEFSQIETEEQAGFRLWSIHNLPYILCKATDREKMAVDQPLHLLFVDLGKAYDSVPLKN